MTKYDFPGESAEYQRSRKELLEAEIALRDQIERVAQMRRALPLGMPMPDYSFREGQADLSRNDPADFSEVRLSDLFEDGHDQLIVDHLMFAPDDDAPCIMCSMWADGYSAIAPHIQRQASFVIVAKAEIGKLRRWARDRRWDRVRLLSSHDNSFNRDMRMERADGSQEAGISVFTRDASGTVYHHYTVSADLPRGDLDLYEGEGRGIDPYSPVWNLLDLLPSGRGQWYPDHPYMESRALAAD